MSKLKEIVADKLKDSSETIKDFVVESLYRDEIKRRGEIVIKAISLQENLNKELAKIDKADQVFKDKEGKIITEAYSQDKLNNINKAKEKVTKMNSLLDKCLADCLLEDYNKLEEFMKQNASGNKPESSAKAE
jgi:hypothetical protein